MFFYQSDNSNRNGHIQIDVYENFAFPLHLHGDLELALPLEGEIRVRLRDREERVKTGEMALVLPHELHGYACDGACRVLVCVFSQDHVHAFSQAVEGMRAEKSAVPCPPELMAYLKETFLAVQWPDFFTCKAAFYAVCAEYRKNVRFLPVQAVEDGALAKLFLYVEQNYRENITLSGAARAIGYNENYLSRCFHQATGVNFRQFLNYHRIQYVCQKRRTDGRSLSSLALESGFQNLRSFNRAFRERMGMPPREYFRNTLP